MQILLQVIGLIALVAGTLFSILGILGMLRLPDVFTRLHATGKVSAFGTVLLLVAAISLTPLSAGKGIVLIFLILLAAPAVSHAIASAAYRSGVSMKIGQRDELKERIDQ